MDVGLVLRTDPPGPQVVERGPPEGYGAGRAGGAAARTEADDIHVPPATDEVAHEGRAR